jgi:hypothetical protein
VTLTPEQAGDLQRATGELLVRAVDAQAIGLLEVSVAARIAAVVRNGGQLDTNSARQAWRILVRNEGRLNAAGLTMPTVPKPAVVAVTAPAQRPPVARSQPQLAIRSDGRIGITGSPFALNEALKTEAVADWDSTRRQWHVPATAAHAAAVAAILTPHAPLMSDRVRALVTEFATNAERRTVLHPDAELPPLDITHECGIDTSLLEHGEFWEHQIRAVEYATHASASMRVAARDQEVVPRGLAHRGRQTAQPPQGWPAD